MSLIPSVIARAQMTGSPQYDRFLAGFIIGKVLGLTLTFAQRIFGLLVGALAIAMAYVGATAGVEALTTHILGSLQALFEQRVLATGMAAGFVAALVLGPALAGRSQPQVN
jgi:ABC-type microcin C transport system permease subunit YejE